MWQIAATDEAETEKKPTRLAIGLICLHIII